jgi:hypothetical protein
VTSQALATAPSVAPIHASLISHGNVSGGSVQTRISNAPPSALASRPVVALHAPPPASVPFALQERALAANAGQPLPPAQVAAIRQSMPSRPDLVTVRPVPVVRPLANGGQGTTPVRAGSPPIPPPSGVTPGQPSPSAPVLSTQSRVVPVQPGPPPTVAPPARVIPHPPLSPLDQSYQAERAQMEIRHQQEFAKPPAGESVEALSLRHDAEHQELEQRYQKARASGQDHLPPKGSKN